MASFNLIETLETSSRFQESFNFDFAGDFSDKNIDIDAGFSTASDTSTWVYGNTARLTDDQYSNPDPSSLRFSDRAKTLSEGESFAVLDNDGEIWYCTIEESASRGHGDRFDGVIVSYFLAEQGELIDDYGSSVSEHGFLAIDDNVNGDIENLGDLDWFAVELNAGSTYQFTLEGDSLEDPFLSLYQANGVFIDSNDDADGLESDYDSQLTFQAEVSGTYYLEASGLNDDYTGSYTLSAIQANDNSDDYGSSVSGHGFLAVDDNVNGDIENLGDLDWFAVELNAGSTYQFTLEGDSLEDPFLSLYQANGVFIDSNDDADGSEPDSYDSQLTFQAEVSGTYYLEASGLNDNYIGSYILSAIELEDVFDDYGSSISEHGFLSIDDNISGAIEASFDLDWFAIELNAGSTYQFTLEGDSLEDPFLALYQSNGDFIDDNDDGNGLGLDSRLIFEVEASGTYYLEASGLDNLTGSYTLNSTLYNIVDDNNDGFVDDVTNYQVYAGDDVVDITYRGRTVSDTTSPQWDLTKAVYIDDSFELLLEGANRKNGKFRGVTANSLGSVTGASRWYTGSQMASQGYEEIFGIDFNSDNQIGF